MRSHSREPRNGARAELALTIDTELRTKDGGRRKTRAGALPERTFIERFSSEITAAEAVDMLAL